MSRIQKIFFENKKIIKPNNRSLGIDAALKHHDRSSFRVIILLYSFRCLIICKQ